MSNPTYSTANFQSATPALPRLLTLLREIFGATPLGLFLQSLKAPTKAR